jgi:hypothetical protein
VNCQAVFDVVTLHRVVVLHDFARENETKLLGFSFKLFSDERFELRREKTERKTSDD